MRRCPHRSIASITRQTRPVGPGIPESETQGGIPYGSQTIHHFIGCRRRRARRCAAFRNTGASGRLPAQYSVHRRRRDALSDGLPVRHQRRRPVSRRVHAEHLQAMAKRRQVRQPTHGEHRLQPGARCACHRSLLASELGDPDDQRFPGHNQQRATGAETGLPDLRQIAAPSRLSDALHRQMAHIYTKCQQGRADGLRL
jgi:hypothetical protein